MQESFTEGEMVLTFADGSMAYFVPAEFHIHAPSEHSFDGVLRDLELHFFHLYNTLVAVRVQSLQFLSIELQEATTITTFLSKSSLFIQLHRQSNNSILKVYISRLFSTVLT